MNPAPDGWLLDHPVEIGRLVRPLDEALEGVTSAEPVVEALTAFARLLTPLSLDVVLLAYERESQRPVPLRQPLWFAVDRVAERELGLAPSTTNPSHSMVDRLTPGAARRVLVDAFSPEDHGPDVLVT